MRDSSSNALARLVHSHGMIDLGFAGNQFTWNNKRPPPFNIREELDRAFCTAEWMVLFPQVRVMHLTAHKSDHFPILLNIVGDEMFLPKPFRFEAMWTFDPTSREVVDDA